MADWLLMLSMGAAIMVAVLVVVYGEDDLD